MSDPDFGGVLRDPGAAEPSRQEPDLPRQHDADRLHLPRTSAVRIRQRQNTLCCPR